MWVGSVDNRNTISLPGESFGALYRPPPHCRRGAVHACEVHAVNQAYHLAPRVGVDGTVYVEHRDGCRNKRARHPLPCQRDTGLIIEVVKRIVSPAHFSVGSPHIVDGPVEYRIGIIYPLLQISVLSFSPTN